MIGVWLGVLASGIHATVAGILVAMAVPVRGRIQSKHFFTIAREKLAELEASNLSGDITNADQMEALEQLHNATSDLVPAGPSLNGIFIRSRRSQSCRFSRC